MLCFKGIKLIKTNKTTVKQIVLNKINCFSGNIWFFFIEINVPLPKKPIIDSILSMANPYVLLIGLNQPVSI